MELIFCDSRFIKKTNFARFTWVDSINKENIVEIIFAGGRFSRFLTMLYNGKWNKANENRKKSFCRIKLAKDHQAKFCGTYFCASPKIIASSGIYFCALGTNLQKLFPHQLISKKLLFLR